MFKLKFGNLNYAFSCVTYPQHKQAVMQSQMPVRQPVIANKGRKS